MAKYLIGLVIVDVEGDECPSTVFGQLHTSNGIKDVTEDLCHALEDEGCRPIPPEANEDAAFCAADILKRTAEGMRAEGVVRKDQLPRKHQIH